MDLPTLFAANIGLSIVVSLTLAFTANRRSGELYLWAAATAMHALAYGLGALRGQIPDFLSIVVGNTLFSISLAFMAEGVYHFQNRRPNRFVLWALVPITFLVFLVYIDSMAVRLLVGALLLDVQIIQILVPLFTQRHRFAGRGQYITMFGFTLALVCTFGRVALVVSGNVPESLASAGSFYNLMFFGNMMALLLVTVGMVMMVQESIQQQLIDREEQIKRLAYRDELTQLPNRRFLLEQLQQTVTAQSHKSGHMGVMFIDLDKFKDLNDSLGHRAGDDLLVQVAQRLRGLVRQSDCVARFGGDEFVVLLLMQETDAARARDQTHAVARKIRQAIGEPYRLQCSGSQGENSCQYSLSASIGVLVVDQVHSVQQLLDQADSAMYQAKKKGRDTIVFGPDAMVTAAS